MRKTKRTTLASGYEKRWRWRIQYNISDTNALKGIGYFVIDDRKEQDRRYYNNHKEQILEYQKVYYCKNIEIKKKYRKGYYYEHREESIKYSTKYIQMHRAHRRKYLRNWRLNHKQKNDEYQRRYRRRYRKELIERAKEYRHAHPVWYSEMQRRHNAKRQRGLGFIPLNNLFPDSHAHHIDKDHVIYVPRKLHESTPHNIWTGKGMREINDKAFAWLATTDKLLEMENTDIHENLSE